jgi:hypothetical protein
MLVYSIVIPVFPFQLERLGYSHVSSLVGWLLFAYVRALRSFHMLPVTLSNLDSRVVWYFVRVFSDLATVSPEIDTKKQSPSL